MSREHTVLQNLVESEQYNVTLQLAVMLVLKQRYFQMEQDSLVGNLGSSSSSHRDLKEP